MTSRSTSVYPGGSAAVVFDTGVVRYELVRSLGQGHHGELLLTRQRHRSGLEGGLFLIKRLNEVTSQQEHARLVEEGMLVSRLQHPCIQPVVTVEGSSEEPLVISLFFEGEWLHDVMHRGARSGRPLPEDFACHVVQEVAEGLHCAHEALDAKGQRLDVVHRDVSPSGILLSRHGQVLLSDFGASWSRLEGRLSSEGDSEMGPLAYASPERALLAPLDRRADLFSLGVLFLQMLTGRHLFDATARYEAELLARRISAQGVAIRPALMEGLEELRGSRSKALMHRIALLDTQTVDAATEPVPERLRPIVRKMLAPCKDDRFGTGAEIAEVVRDYLWDTGQRGGRDAVVKEVEAVRQEEGR